MTGARDYQRARVYAWEDRFVAPRDPSAVACAQAQGMVDAIWAETGLRFPPKVVRLPRQARTTIVDATRLLIRLAEAGRAPRIPKRFSPLHRYRRQRCCQGNR